MSHSLGQFSTILTRSILVTGLFILPSLLPAQWSSDPNVNNAICTAMNEQSRPVITSDGSGGAIIAWQDYRTPANSYDIYSQRISTAGVVQWTPVDGVAISTTTNGQSYPVITSDGSGGALIAWMDLRNGSSEDIYAQHVDATGSMHAGWAPNGVALSVATNKQYYPSITTDGSGGAIVAWEDYRSGTNWDIYARRISGAGSVQWNADGNIICSEANDQRNTIIVSDGGGGAIIVWDDNRSGTRTDIYAQRVDGDGNIHFGWAAGGVLISTSVTTGLSQHSMVTDGAGGAIITYTTSGPGLTPPHIYAQRVGGSGTVLWGANGVAICTATPGGQVTPSIAGDGSGGAIITWGDNRTGNSDIYSQRINSSGTVQWQADGVAICKASSAQYYPTITSDGASGAIITWLDYRSGTRYDVYARRISSSGGIMWATDGEAVSTASNIQTILYRNYPVILNDGTGGAIIAWSDNRTGTNLDIYAQNVNSNGTLGAGSQPAHTPVIIIPGIMGSPLFNDVNNDGHLADFFDHCPTPPQSEKVWVDPSRLFGNGLDGLQLNDNGIDPLNPSDRIKVSPLRNDCHTIFDDLTWLPLSKYEGLISDLRAPPYSYHLDNSDDNHNEGEDLFVFTYDWRKSILVTAESLKTFIDSITQRWTGNNKVSIVAHSMGGLIAKRYVQQYGDSRVDKLIFVGTPHLGAPKMYYVALTGDLLGWSGLDPFSDEIRKLANNFPSAYQLFPSQTYYNNIFHPLWWEVLNHVLNYSEVRPLFLWFERNMTLFDNATNFRATLDYVNFGNIEVHNIVGKGLWTIGRINCKSSGITIDPQWGILGDGTVPEFSADYINGLVAPDLGVVKGKHEDLCTYQEVRNKIAEILASPSLAKSNFARKQLDTLTSHVSSNFTIKVDHEVALHAYDSLGNHTGPTSDTTWESNIPGSEYIPGDLHQANSLKVVILPRNGNYHFVVQSQDTTSYFNLVMDDVVDGNAAVSVAYDSIPTLPNTVARSTFQSVTADLDLVVDKNGDSTELAATRPSTLQIGATTLRHWNLVSIPATVYDSSKVSLFPSSISNAFWYNLGVGYQTDDTLHTRKGYWLKFDSSEVISFYGIPRLIDTIPVQQGWNLIGTISKSVTAASVTSDPARLITSHFFEYRGTYVTCDTLESGKGYWVKVNQAGSLILSAQSSQAGLSRRIKIVPTSELPPPPPDEGFVEPSNIPKSFALQQNYPNPFNPSTTIRYSLPIDSRVILRVYNILGQEIATLVNEIQTAGNHEAVWRSSSNTSSGVYYYRMKVGSFVETKKLVLLR